MSYLPGPISPPVLEMSYPALQNPISIAPYCTVPRNRGSMTSCGVSGSKSPNSLSCAHRGLRGALLSSGTSTGAGHTPHGTFGSRMPYRAPPRDTRLERDPTDSEAACRESDQRRPAHGARSSEPEAEGSCKAVICYCVIYYLRAVEH